MKTGVLRTKLAVLSILLPAMAVAQKYYSDDPLAVEPQPIAVEDADYRSLNYLFQYLSNLFGKPGERHPLNGVIPSRGINTLGEVPDGLWFVNRHGSNRLTDEELKRGSGDQDPPSRKEPWRVLSLEKHSVRMGLWIEDADNSLYMLRFDPPGRLEMSTGAGMIGSRLYHAMGYWVPEHYLVYFERDQLTSAPPEKELIGAYDGKVMDEKEIDLFLKTLPSDPIKGYRALAVKVPSGARRLGPYQFYGTRSDDPNDITPHEHRRDLRGLHVLSAWVGNNWIGANLTQDMLLEENNVPFIRHYIEDFLTLLGSGFNREKDPREGFEALFVFRQTLKNFGGLGIYSPAWQRVDYPAIGSIGLFESALFDPSEWKPNYPAAALANHLPDDDFWAAKLLMAFTDEDIHTIVETAQYSDARAKEWIARCLIERRDKIGRYCFEMVLPLDHFRLEGDHLTFEDLAVRYGFRRAREYSIQWSEFNNLTGEHRSIAPEVEWDIPEQAQTAEIGAYFSAEISTDEQGKTATVYVRKEHNGFKLVGIERSWPDKNPADESVHTDSH